MKNIIKQAEILKLLIKNNSNKIDNPVLTTTVLMELNNLIDFLKDEE